MLSDLLTNSAPPGWYCARSTKGHHCVSPTG